MSATNRGFKISNNIPDTGVHSYRTRVSTMEATQIVAREVSGKTQVGNLRVSSSLLEQCDVDLSHRQFRLDLIIRTSTIYGWQPIPLLALATATRCSERQVARDIKHLIALGRIEAERHGWGEPMSYRAVADAQPKANPNVNCLRCSREYKRVALNGFCHPCNRDIKLTRNAAEFRKNNPGQPLEMFDIKRRVAGNLAVQRAWANAGGEE